MTNAELFAVVMQYRDAMERACKGGYKPNTPSTPQTRAADTFRIGVAWHAFAASTPGAYELAGRLDF